MKKLTLLCATTALVMPTMAFAQSTGSVEAENEAEIVVTGTRTKDVGGVQAPDTPKAKAVLTSEFIQHQTPGQTINDTINQLPGVSFQNNDPYGSAGGTMTIRGFDNTRISQTFDGVPLNDSGNYALFSNQQMDPELIEQVNVNLGSTDVDSPTAAASGSTVNYRTRLPFEEFHARLQGSVGEYNFLRTFGVIDTGAIGPMGTRAFFAASSASNDNVFNHRGKIDKQQYNGRVYQPIGSNGDFVSISGHYNQNRNNFFGSVALREDLVNSPNNAAPRLVPDRFPVTDDERFYTIARCSVNLVARTGLADLANTCGSTFDERYNPSNTGNIRVGSRFSIMDNLTLTVDPSIQFVKANGGGTVVGQEARRDVNATGGNANCNTTANSATVSCQTGYIGGIPYYGRDLNGDGDLLDTIRVLAPSQTATRRYGLIAGLRYDINDDHYIRVNYSWDRARHRQTGETNFLRGNGEPTDVFPINAPLGDVGGNVLEKRDRLSFAILHQLSAEYRGEFIDGRLTVQAGIRAPFFTRDLTNYCATSSSAGFVECFGTNSAGLAAYLATNPTQGIGSGQTAPTQGPQRRVLKYDKLLPNVGLVFDVTNELSMFTNFSMGLQVPGTDSLYNSFFFPPDHPSANPRPETTNNVDAGLRYRAHNVVAQGSVWYTLFKNRLAQAFDVDADRNVFRNLGTVDKYGVDASVSYQIIPELQLYAYGSYLKSKIRDDVVAGECVNTTTPNCTSVGQALFAPTAGRRESGAPVYTFGGRIQGKVGPVEIGLQAKRTGPRYVNDMNSPITLCTAAFVNNVCPVGSPVTPTSVKSFVVYGAKTPAYTLVDLDVRIPLKFVGLNDDTFLQLNVTNLFDQRYVGGFGGTLLDNNAPFVQIGAPRAISGTLVVGF
jgi:iron complex outermembrane receptor protein